MRGQYAGIGMLYNIELDEFESLEDEDAESPDGEKVE